MNLYGWIIYNGNLPGNQFIDFANMIQEAATEQNIKTTIYKNNDLLAYLSGDSIQLMYDNQKSLPDFVVFTDKDIYLASHLEQLGIRVFNRAKAIDISDDKIATYQKLALHQLPFPETVIAPKIFFHHEQVDLKFAESVVEKLSFPMIIKEAFGSFGEQVYLVHTFEEMITKMQQLESKPYVFQQFISSSYGRDIRLHVIGDEVPAAMVRQSESDFRSNVTAGGHMQKYDPTKEEQQLAIAATKAIGADFAGVDLLVGPNNNLIICEVNSNAHIRNLYDCTNINVAHDMIHHIITCMK